MPGVRVGARHRDHLVQALAVILAGQEGDVGGVAPAGDPDHAFDPAHARAIGLPVRALHFGLLTLLALTIVAALKAVGIILVVAMLITPGCVGYLLTDRFERMMLISFASAQISCVGGIYAGFYLNGSTGSCIVLVQALQFLLVMIFAPKHGLLASAKRSN